MTNGAKPDTPEGSGQNEVDGISRRALLKTAAVVTKPVTCSGKRLWITADAEGGRVRAEVIGEKGPSLADCAPLTGTLTKAGVRWRGGDLSALRGKGVRLRFELTGATLYSFGFAD